MRFVQFRLATLFWLTAIAAFLVFAWLRFVRPNVSHVTVNRYAMVIYLSDAWHRWMRTPYWDDETGEIVYPEGAFNDGIPIHDAFILIPWSGIIVTVISIILTSAASYLTFRQLRRWRTLSSKG